MHLAAVKEEISVQVPSPVLGPDHRIPQGKFYPFVVYGAGIDLRGVISCRSVQLPVEDLVVRRPEITGKVDGDPVVEEPAFKTGLYSFNNSGFRLGFGTWLGIEAVVTADPEGVTNAFAVSFR